MCDPAISVIVRTRSVCDRCIGGRLRNGSECGGNGLKFVRSERPPPEKLAIANRV